MGTYRETDLYLPIYSFFTDIGYDVRAEVNGCDVVLLKDGVLSVIELKTSFNVTLLIQALNRQTAASQVYIAIPRPKRAKGPQYQGMLKICRKLELGLITVALDSPTKAVSILIFPPPVDVVKSGKKRDMLLHEIGGRKFNKNIGGSSGRWLMTAYREKAIYIACLLSIIGEASSSELKKYGADETAYNIMRRNAYGWFLSTGKAVFALTDEGKRAVTDGRFGEVAAYYMAEAVAKTTTG